MLASLLSESIFESICWASPSGLNLEDCRQSAAVELSNAFTSSMLLKSKNLFTLGMARLERMLSPAMTTTSSNIVNPSF